MSGHLYFPPFPFHNATAAEYDLIRTNISRLDQDALVCSGTRSLWIFGQLNDQGQPKINFDLRSWSFVMLIVNWVAWVSPESNPAGALLFAARYVQGFAKEDCVTECPNPGLSKKIVNEKNNGERRHHCHTWGTRRSPTFHWKP